MLLVGKFEDKYGEKLMDPATKRGADATKPVSRRLVLITTEFTSDLIGNKEDDKTKKIPKIYKPPEKRTNYWKRKIVLIPYKNQIPKFCYS